jgi:hypothetical protein
VNRVAIVAAALVGVLVTPAKSSASSITNGGFEDGLSGWTIDSAGAGSLLFGGGHGHSGSGAAVFGAIGTHDDTLSQTFATDPGESYTLTFWLSHGATDNVNDFSAWWDGTPLLELRNAPRFGQQRYTFVLTALDDQTTLRFSGRELRDYYFLDDVDVAPIPTPEPTTVILMVGGIVIMTRLRKRPPRSEL